MFSTMTIARIILALSLLAAAATVTLASAPDGAYIQCDGSKSSPVRCTPDGW
jgi:hypothetical protein